MNFTVNTKDDDNIPFYVSRGEINPMFAFFLENLQWLVEMSVADNETDLEVQEFTLVT